MKRGQDIPSESTVPVICRECMSYANCPLALDENLRQTCPAIRDEGKLRFRNHEGYPDPTAYYAMRNIERERRKKATEEKAQPRSQRPRTRVERYD